MTSHGSFGFGRHHNELDRCWLYPSCRSGRATWVQGVLAG